MKIIIIGAGISGLTTYLFLRKHLPNPASHSITIYEAYDISKLYSSNPSSAPEADHFLVTAIGNAIGIGANGLNVLHRLDQDILNEVLARGCPTHSWRITNARGWKLADVKMPDVTDGSTGAPSIMIARQALWEVLRDHVPVEDIVHRKVVDVVIRKAKRNEIAFADGCLEEADLVLGADGLRSIVRTAMFREEVVVDGRDYITPKYEGLSGVGGFIDADVLTASGCRPGTMDLVFGPNGFFGFGIIESGKGEDGKVRAKTGGWWSTYQEPICPERKKIDKVAVSEALAQRHRRWKNGTVQAILKHIAENGKALDDIYPTWTTPELPTWEKYGCVLVGDAAHALQPSSGQGTSQAFEDAEAFTLLLKHYMSRTAEVSFMAAIEKASKEYVAMRKPRLHDIYVRTQKFGKMKGDQGFLMEMIMSAAIYAMSEYQPFRMFTYLLTTFDSSFLQRRIQRKVDEL
jgi:2-polyprenyl-6-methoxyphenol hydroxylase-like FAD-dependent oxidoreductase